MFSDGNVSIEGIAVHDRGRHAVVVPLSEQRCRILATDDREPEQSGARCGALGGAKRITGALRRMLRSRRRVRELQSVWPSLRRINPLWDPGPEYRAHPSVTPLQTELVGLGARAALDVVWCDAARAAHIVRERCQPPARARGHAGTRARRARSARGRSRATRAPARHGEPRARRIRRAARRDARMARRAHAGRSDARRHSACRGDLHEVEACSPSRWAISIGAGLLFGLIPAFRATSVSDANSSGAAGDRRVTAGGSHSHFRRARGG